MEFQQQPIHELLGLARADTKSSDRQCYIADEYFRVGGCAAVWYGCVVQW